MGVGPRPKGPWPPFAGGEYTLEKARMGVGIPLFPTYVLPDGPLILGVLRRNLPRKLGELDSSTPRVLVIF